VLQRGGESLNGGEEVRKEMKRLPERKWEERKRR